MKDSTGASSAGTGALSRVPTQTSLRNSALRRTSKNYVPRTLTPHEWEAYYEANGVPPSHRNGAD